MMTNLYLSQEGLTKLKQELEQLLLERKEVSARIKEAREFGDLSENAEYVEAKTKQSFIEGRIEEIQVLLKNATMIENNRGRSAVSLGSRVKLKSNGSVVEYTLSGSNEASPMEGKISNESPLGRALLGRRKGEEFVFETPDGKRKYQVLEIR
jgi:transcription elongation factor GreA